MQKPKPTSRPSVKTESTRRGLDMDKVATKQKEVEDRSSGDFLELKEGWTFVYLLPPWSDEGVIWKEVEQHGRIVCPKRMADKDCMICDEVVKRGRKGDSDFVEQHRLRSRAFFNAVRKDDLRKMLAAPASVIKVLAVSSMVFREILEYINDEKVDVSDPACAVPLGIKRTGKGMRTRYKVKFGEPVDISKYITAKVMDCLHDLDVLRAAQPATTKDMRKAIRGAADEEDDDFGDDEEIKDEDIDEDEPAAEASSEEDEVFEEPGGAEEEVEEEAEESAEEEVEEPPRRVKPKPTGTPKRKPEPEEEPEEEVEEEVEEEAEDDEPPEGWDEEEEEEEEEPPPPKPRKPLPGKPVVKPKPTVSSKPVVKPGALAAKVKASVKAKR